MFLQLALMFDADKLVRQINAGNALPMTSYMDAIFKGKVTTFIALELGTFLKEKHWDTNPAKYDTP